MPTSRVFSAVCLAFGVACSGEREPARTDSGAPLGGDGARRRAAVTAVQLGSFADSGNALALRDSLARAGWVVYLSRGEAAGAARWRVLVQPSSSAEVPRLVQQVLAAQGRETFVVRDTGDAPATGSAEIIPVNRGAEGMLRRVQWALSPDGRSMLAVEDPAGVENEPVPNGFVFVSEAGPFLMQMDSVWDVAPSPTWDRLVYGRAHIVETRPRESEILAEQWEEMADRMSLPVDSVRRAAFTSSSMNIAFATAQPVVVDVSDRALAGSASSGESERRIRVAGGWRIGWASDGATLALGTRPGRATNDADPERWIAVDTLGWRPQGLLPAGRQVWSPEWQEGPLIDISIPFDMRAPRSVRIEGGRVASRDGWIRISRDSVDAVAGGRIVAPGAVLAATRGGQFIAALVQRQVADRFEVPLRFVVYQIIE